MGFEFRGHIEKSRVMPEEGVWGTPKINSCLKPSPEAFILGMPCAL